MKNPIAKFLVSFAGIGYIRPASATWGSLASGAVLFFFWPGLEPWVKILIIVLTFILGVFLSDSIERSSKIHDPHFIVIDEVVGMMIVTLFLTSVWQHWLAAFLLFRLFDIAKLWPASLFDKKPGGFSIMIDDVIMALPALAILELVLVSMA